MANYQTLLQAILGSGAVHPYSTAQTTNQLPLPTPPIAQPVTAQSPIFQTIGQMLAPATPPAGSNTLTGASTPPMFAQQPAQQAQAQPVPQATPMIQPQAQQGWNTPGPGGNTGPLNWPGIIGQVIGGQGKVRKPVSIGGAFGFGGAPDNQVSENADDATYGGE
jgi:hypothetical protein